MNDNEMGRRETSAGENRQHSYAYVVPVKFRNASKPYSFGTNMPDLRNGDKVVVETAQGLEMGVVEGPTVAIDQYPSSIPLKPVLRVADQQDQHDYEENFTYSEEAFRLCESEIARLKLNMHLLSAEYTLDRSKALFVYLADQRVDFRELLKRLAVQLHCRIELRQIGERDKAKMVGGIGMCGMECCCSRFKSRFDVISINMAKNQLLALNIDKLSGQCGKLMCCLKYEDADYKEMTKGLPKMGAQIEYEGVLYRVTSMNVMSNQAKLENRETSQFITLDELKEKGIVRKGQAQQPKKKREPDQAVKKSTAAQPQSQPERPEQKAADSQPQNQNPAAQTREKSGHGRHRNHHRGQHGQGQQNPSQPNSGGEKKQ